MTDLYVSPTGSDSNNGSQAAPFATILAASQKATPGTTIHVAAGSYAGGFTTTASGTSSAHISYVSGGAKILGANCDMAWWNKGDYVDIKNFQVDGGGTGRIGLYGSGSHCTFQGNVVHDMLTDATAYANAQASGNGGAGIEMDAYYGGVDGSIIANTVYNIGPAGQSSSLVHGIYQIETGTVANNIVYNVVGVGITTWHGAHNINIINNTIDGARDGGIYVGSGDGGSSTTTGDYFNVENNIITNSKFGIYEGGTTGVHNRYANNLLYNDGGVPIRLQHGLIATGTITADPKFVNAAAHDYHLQAGSPAIGAGLATFAPATDFAGNPRPANAIDLGAYQAGDVIVVQLAEDQGNGDAQFVLLVDGHQQGPAQTVTTLHSSGHWQSFVFRGNFGPGPHTVSIALINDSGYSGSPSANRKLYVGSINYNGKLLSEVIRGTGSRQYSA